MEKYFYKDIQGAFFSIAFQVDVVPLEVNGGSA